MPSRVSGRDSYRRGGKNPVMSAFNEYMLPKQQKKATHRDGGVSSQFAHGAKGSVDPISPSQYSSSLVGKLTRMPRNRRGCMQSMHQRDPRLRGRNQSSRKDQCQTFQQWQSCAANCETLWIGIYRTWHSHLNMSLLQTTLDQIHRALECPLRPVPTRQGATILILLVCVDIINGGGGFNVGHR